MTVPQLIERLQKLVARGLPAGHVVEAGLDDPLTILGPLEGGAREILKEIKL